MTHTSWDHVRVNLTPVGEPVHEAAELDRLDKLVRENDPPTVEHIYYKTTSHIMVQAAVLGNEDRTVLVVWDITSLVDPAVYDDPFESLPEEILEINGVKAAYVHHGTDEDARSAAIDDVRRLAIAAETEAGSHLRITGWRGWAVIFAKDIYGDRMIAATLPDGRFAFHADMNALESVAAYAALVNELAGLLNYGSQQDLDAEFNQVRHIVHAYLLKEAADVQLDQARLTLKLSLGQFARQKSQPISISELARSLHTDRPNLSRVIASARGELAKLDEDITRLQKRIREHD